MRPFSACLFRPHPNEELTRRVVTLRAHELRERTLDLDPGLLLLGAAEPSHQLAQGKGPSCVLHGLCQGRKTPPGGNRVDGYLPEASRSERVLQNARSAKPELAESLRRRRGEAAQAKRDRVREREIGAPAGGRKHDGCKPAARLQNP